MLARMLLRKTNGYVCPRKTVITLHQICEMNESKFIHDI